VVSFWVTAVGTALTFFPMHIVGLLGMTRRVYTYRAGLGWGIYNLLETVGGFLLAAGLVLIALNLFVSLRTGRPAGPDPFYGGTLEWTVPSPPPHYNFAVIPTVTSPYPNWDRGDREADEHRLERDGISLLGGHETPASSPADGLPAGILEMPSESGSPILLAACVTAIFALLLTSHYAVAGLAGLLALAVLAAWHAKEPEE
jgi:cytochrome c oxidase subunit I+III